MSDISQDELTILMIAANGESMMPIGRWKAPVESLVAKGYLRAENQFNNFITDAGRAALEADEKETDTALGQVIERTAATIETQKTLARRGEQIARELAAMARESNAVKGDDPVTALREWSRVILERALELLR